MLYRLTINSRSSRELRQLADERRTLAASKDSRLKALLLREARLLESYAELRDWMDRADGRVGLRSSDAAMFTAQNANTRHGHTRHVAPVSPTGPSVLANHVAVRLALDSSDQQALLAPAVPRHVLKGEILSEEGDTLSALTVLCSGMAKATRMLADGTQQIVAIYVAGDMLNAGDLTVGRSSTSIAALTSTISLSVPLPALRSLMEARPSIIRALWRETAAQAAIAQEWMIGLGRRTAEARLAHFMCEMSCRLELGHPDALDGVDLPLTQQDLSDILGLSAVHVNRVLQGLRGAELIEFDRGRLKILDRAGLYAVAEFDERYLSGFSRPDAGSF
jgi:CRP-like cAMP-binding protein